jgi:hypothetical protein
MVFRRTFSVSLILLLLSLVTVTRAFDGERKGLIFGGGVGFGLTYFHSKIDSLPAVGLSNSVVKFGPAVDVRAGYAWSNREMIFMGAKMSMAYFDEITDSYDSYFGTIEDGGILGTLAILALPWAMVLIPMSGSHSIMGIVGGTYYFSDSAPCYFVEGTIGPGIIPDEFTGKTEAGVGLSLAGGYEFQKHWNVRSDILIAVRKYSPSGTYSVSDYSERNIALTIMFTVNWLEY